MKKINGVVVIFLCFLALCKNVNPARAEEQIQLIPEKVKIKLGISEDISEESVDTPTKVLRGAVDLISPDGLQLEEGIVKSIKAGVVYEGPLRLEDIDGKEFMGNHTVTAVDTYVRLKFRDDKTEFRFMYNFMRKLPNIENTFTEKFSEVALTHRLNPHQTIILGQGARIPVGIDGLIAPQAQDTALRSQTARNFSNARAFGIRNIGDYKYLDYDIGVYDSTRHFQNMFNGAEVVGWVNVKPLANLDTKKYGKLTVGGGAQLGKAADDYQVVGTYVGYDYKKAHLKMEYMQADGYNNANSYSNKEARGFHSTVVYDLTKKIQLVGRYDIYDPNTVKSKNSITEYTAGINYTVSKHLKFLLNYVRQNKEAGPDGNLFLFVTRFTI